MPGVQHLRLPAQQVADRRLAAHSVAARLHGVASSYITAAFQSGLGVAAAIPEDLAGILLALGLLK